MFTGGTFRHFLEKRFTLAEEDARPFVIALAKGLTFLHEAGVVHRDLKPDNVMFRHNGAPVIVDFGLSLVWKESPPRGEEKIMVGTAPYLAPEAISEKMYYPSTDFWSLGIMLFEMIFGRVRAAVLVLVDADIPKFPFKVLVVTHDPETGRKVKEDFQRIVNDEPNFPKHMESRASQKCKEFMLAVRIFRATRPILTFLQLLNKNPHTRIHDAKVFDHVWMQEHMEDGEEDDCDPITGPPEWKPIEAVAQYHSSCMERRIRDAARQLKPTLVLPKVRTRRTSHVIRRDSFSRFLKPTVLKDEKDFPGLFAPLAK